MSVGTNIKRRRYELKMSQQELADAMGYKTRSTIAKIESGENDVSQKKLEKFASVLDTTVEELITGFAKPDYIQPIPVPIDDTNRNKNIAIILAGGKSGRNRQNIPSQFINIHGKPILVYAMDAYQAHPAVDAIYVVCLKGWESIVKAYAKQYSITKLKGLIIGGASGMISLKNALEYIGRIYAPEDLIIVQESTRPLVRVETISRLLQACTETGSATLCHSMKEYVQFHLAGEKADYIDRSKTIALQSPEAHRLSLMLEVFSKAAGQPQLLNESCCTMLLYHLGYPINFIESDNNNIKITREEDIAAFSALVKE